MDENVIIPDEGHYKQITDSMPNFFEIKKIQQREKKLDIVNIAISKKGAEKAKPILDQSQATFNREFKKLANYNFLTDERHITSQKLAKKENKGKFIQRLKRRLDRNIIIVKKRIEKDKKYQD